MLDGIDDRTDPVSDRLKLHRRQIDLRQTVCRGIFHQVVDMGGPDECLTRYAPKVKAVSAQRLFLFHQK